MGKQIEKTVLFEGGMMKKLRYPYMFLLGLLAFFISNVLLGKYLFLFIFYVSLYSEIINNEIFTGLIIITISILSEGFRFLFKKYLVKNSEMIYEPILFGLGFSFMIILNLFIKIGFFMGLPLTMDEGLWMLDEITACLPFISGGLGILEGIFLILLNIELSVLIWNGFLVNRKKLYLVIAILINIFCRVSMYVLIYFNINIYGTVILFALILIFVGIRILKINKLKWKA